MDLRVGVVRGEPVWNIDESMPASLVECVMGRSRSVSLVEEPDKVLLSICGEVPAVLDGVFNFSEAVPHPGEPLTSVIAAVDNQVVHASQEAMADRFDAAAKCDWLSHTERKQSRWRARGQVDEGSVTSVRV